MCIRDRREHVGQALAEGALPRARMQVLSILLKPRQVCCHPKLFLPDYDGCLLYTSRCV